MLEEQPYAFGRQNGIQDFVIGQVKGSERWHIEDDHCFIALCGVRTNGLRALFCARPKGQMVYCRTCLRIMRSRLGAILG